MLEILKIKKFALIHEAEISFKEGLNIISGETGAGKSIVLEAIGLILGGRAKQDLIQKDAEEAQVEGFFDISHLKFVQQRLKKFELPFENEELHIKRTVPVTGKNKIYINGEMATLNVLQDVCEGLIDLCGQHEHQSLLKTVYQIELVDHYAGLERKTADFSSAFLEYKKLLDERSSISNVSEEHRMEFIKFQIDELSSADLKEGEDEFLQEKKKLFQSSQQRYDAAVSAQKILSYSDQDQNASSLIELFQTALFKIEGLYENDPSVKLLYDKAMQVKIDLEEIDQSLNSYLESMDLNEEESILVKDRLALIASFRRKYGPTVSEMIQKLAHLKSEYFEFENKEFILAELDKKIFLMKNRIIKLDAEISQKRRNVAKTFSKTVTQELKDLNMMGSVFEVEWEEKKDFSEWTLQGGSLGVQFCIQTNQGDKKLPLSKIASGGELSRVMLGIRRVMSDQGGIGVYLFDEIDSGMGGKTAFQVGKKLKSVSKGNQVICITHLPQVAAFSDHHIKVEKNISKNKTKTRVRVLSKQEKTEELARMLGGPKLTKSSIQNAEELILQSC